MCERLDRLEAEGLEVRPKSGRLAGQSTEYHEIHDPRGWIELRQQGGGLSPRAAERLWTAAGPGKVATLRKGHPAAYQPKYFDKSQALNQTFHETILEAAKPTAARIRTTYDGWSAFRRAPRPLCWKMRQSTRQNVPSSTPFETATVMG